MMAERGRWEGAQGKNVRVKQVTGYNDAHYALLADGNVVSWGSNGRLLGHGNARGRHVISPSLPLVHRLWSSSSWWWRRVYLSSQPTPIRSLLGISIAQIAIGLSKATPFVLFLSVAGGTIPRVVAAVVGVRGWVWLIADCCCADVFSFGDNSEGQLGHDDRLFRSTPRLVAALKAPALPFSTTFQLWSAVGGSAFSDSDSAVVATGHACRACGGWSQLCGGAERHGRALHLGQQLSGAMCVALR
jgi:hypothetical protein